MKNSGDRVGFRRRRLELKDNWALPCLPVIGQAEKLHDSDWWKYEHSVAGESHLGAEEKTVKEAMLRKEDLERLGEQSTPRQRHVGDTKRVDAMGQNKFSSGTPVLPPP